MEKIVSNKNWDKGVSLEDANLRMSSRPTMTRSKPPGHSESTGTPRRRGAAYEDFGSSFGKVPSGSGVKPVMQHRRPGSHNQIGDTSVDELDTLSQPPSSIPPKSSGTKLSDEANVPEEIQAKYKKLPPMLKFKKNNGASQSNASSTQLTPQPSSSDAQIGYSHQKEHFGAGSSQTSEQGSRHYATAPKSRPEPRPIGARLPSSQPQKSPGSSTRQKTVYDENISPIADKTPRIAKDPGSVGQSYLSVKKPKLADFPPIPHTTSDNSIKISSESQDASSKKRVKKSDVKPKAAPATFPSLSPLSKGKTKAKSTTRKSKQRVVSSEASDQRDEDSSSPAPKAQPFPMSTQMLDSIGSSPVADTFNLGPMSPFVSPSSSQGKKRKDSNSSRSGSEYEEENTISPSADPRSLCPYCDAPLPPFPTRLLERLLASTKKKSRREPRPGNPLGRSAPFAVFIAVCQRHRFESEILPEAELKGWPKSINWDELRNRVYRMKASLRAIIDDAHTTVNGGSSSRTGAREQSVFWKETMSELRKKGSRAAASVTGQMASFEKAQPGYYGEMGSAVIHQTLYDLFPPASVHPDLVAPLTINDFIQRILVPEVGLRLIMEDMNLHESRTEDGIRILRESTNYGVAMFPADEREEGGSQIPGKADVADRIVMERARKRRKELEVDEREEEEAMIELEPKTSVKHARRPQARPRPRPASKSSDTGYSATSEDETSSVTSRNGRGTRDRRHRATRNLTDVIEIEATPRGRNVRRALNEIVITSSEDSANEWDIGRMQRDQKNRRHKILTKALTGGDTTPPPSGRSAQVHAPGCSRFPLDKETPSQDTPKPHARQSQTLLETPPLLRAQQRSKRGTVGSTFKTKGSAWLLSDDTHSSQEPD